jgi:serine protease AprX
MRKKAVLLFDPNRRQEQLAFVRDRAPILQEFGDNIWTRITDEQAARFAEQGILVQFHEEADLIELPAVMFDPAAGEPQPPAELTVREPGAGETAYYLVQFIAAPDADWIQALEDLDGTYVQDIPANVAVFRLTTAQAAEAHERTFVSWVGLYHPAYALHYTLAGRDQPFAVADLRNLQIDPARIVPQPSGTLRLLFFQDLDTVAMRPAVEAAGATVRMDTGHSLIVDAPAARVPDLLRIPGVQSVEAHQEATEGNQRAGLILGTNQVRNLGHIDFLVNLDGMGEIVGMLDNGFDTGVVGPGFHTDFAGRVLQISNINSPAPPAPPISAADGLPHGTHVAGSIGADGTNAPAPTPASPNNSVPRGVAPRCQIIFHSANTAVPPAPRNYGNFLRAFQEAYAGGARVHSNSWGTNTNNVYTNAVSAVIDRFTFLHPDMVVLFLAHNFEGDANGDGVLDMNTLIENALPKNVLCIGACESETALDGNAANYRAAWTTYPGRFGHAAFNATAGGAPGAFSMSDNANDMALFSNRGRVSGAPAALRRIKPDLVAPGTNIISTGPGAMLPLGGAAAPANAPAAFYYVSNGTSMATPLTAGACVLTRQFYRTRFSQLRRPLLLEAQVALVDLPSAASHADGCVLGWVHPDAVAGPNHIVAARFSRQLVRVGDIVRLAVDVGAHPAPTLARHGNNTLLLHRASDNTLRLSLWDNALTAVAAFGAAGVVTLGTASRPEDDRRPTLCIRGDEAAVAWFQTGTDTLVFQRFRTDTGAALDAAPRVLGEGTTTSNHPFLIHNGARYAAVWTHAVGASHELRLRFIDNAGNPEGAAPFTLLAQAQAMREAHLTWDAAASRYTVVWVGENTHAGGDIFALRVRDNGTADGAAIPLVTVPAANATRRPRIAAHPDIGFILLWEDNSQGGTHDVYLQYFRLSFGVPVVRTQLRISDTPNNSSGFSALTDAEGVLPLWQSNDEINSDQLGVYALNVTRGGAFQAQVDPDTPLLQSGHYVPHALLEHGDPALNHTAMAWGGGDVYLLRVVPTGLAAELALVRTNADGRPDAGIGALGARAIDSFFGFDAVCLHWAGTRLIAAHSNRLTSNILLLDLDGRPINTFGTNGLVEIPEVPTEEIALQVGHRVIGAGLRIVVAYGHRRDPGPHTLRYTVLDAGGTATVPARDLAAAHGTARQGWFHVVASDAPVHSIAAWHTQVGANMAVQLNRFQHNGAPQVGVAGPITLTTMVGDSQNAVIAPRPMLADPPFPTPAASTTLTRRREYGVAWQFRPAAGAPWEVRFSRLNRDGTVQRSVPPAPPIHDLQVFANPAMHGTDPQLVWHTNGYGMAWLQQPVGGGNHQLFFTVLDPAGVRVSLPPFGVPGPVPVPDHPVSGAGADVQAFQLVWNGRSFRITWTEVEGGRLRHMQSALFVPRLAGLDAAGNPRVPTYDEPFQEPSAALVRATLINGATNLRNTRLPNVPQTGALHNPNDGYGWGRVNLRQSLAPAPPVTFHVRDDASVANGRTVRYVFRLPPNTQLLRITLAWNDPPGRNLVNNLNLRVTTPPFVPGGVRTYVGNRWQAATAPLVNPQPSDPLPAVPPANPFEGVQNVEQVVIVGPPALPAGLYTVDVIGQAIPASAFQQFPGQSFALVFVGSGNELRTAALPAAGPLPVY